MVLPFTGSVTVIGAEALAQLALTDHHAFCAAVQPPATSQALIGAEKYPGKVTTPAAHSGEATDTTGHGWPLLNLSMCFSSLTELFAATTSWLNAATMPASLACIVACRKAMFPAIMLPVSTERIMPIPASVIATNMISAISNTTPRWLRGAFTLRQLFLADFIMISRRQH
jgi:hypothetical protein